MSNDISGLVETSSNLGIIDTEGGRVTLSVSVRSSKDAEKQTLTDKIKELSREYGAELCEHGEYPAWEFRPDSPLTDSLVRIYEKTYKKTPRVEIIHAGLECGLLGQKLPGADMVSIGPDIENVHTPDERMNVASVQRTWDYLLAVLKAIGERDK